MSGFKWTTTAAALIVAGSLNAAHANDNKGQMVTGKLMLDELSEPEYVMFVTGMVEGMAYARFRKDTLEAGEKRQDGMNCIRHWFHSKPESILEISDAFERHPEHTPWVVLGVMLKKECGE
jgi:hypothetical protein